MNSDQIGLSTLIFRESPLNRALEKISTTGAKTVDISIILPTFCPHYNPLLTSTEDDLRLQELIASFGLSVSTLNVVPGYFNKDDPDQVTQFIRRSVDIASLIGAHSVTVPSGMKVDVSCWEDNVRVVKKYCAALVEYATDRNIHMSFETPHVRTLVESIDEARRFYDIMSDLNVKCTLDTSHAKGSAKTEPVDAIRAVGLQRINHVHLRDAVGDDIDFTPGKGMIDFKSFFNYMRENSYGGSYVLELEYEDLTEKQKFKEIAFAKDFCNGLLNDSKLSLSKKIQTSNVGKFIGRIKRNPKSEIKRHKRLLSALKAIKDKIKPYLPEKVYNGGWNTAIRWSKYKIVTHRKNSVKLNSMRSSVVRVGVVGCGYAGLKMHAPGFQRLEGVEIVGAYDIDTRKTESFAARFGAKPCKSLNELVVGLEPNLISVCSREWAHHEAVMFALKHGVDVFCEKLLATRYQHGIEMVRAAQEQNRILGVNYNYRYMPGIRKIKEVIEQQALGQLAYFVINVHAFSYAHALDLLSFMGGKIVSVSAYCRNDNTIRVFAGTDWSVYDDDIQYIPSIVTSVTVEFDSGAVGIVNSSYYYNLHAFVLSLEAVFEKGVVTLNGINMFNTLGNLSFYSRGPIKKVTMNHRSGVYAKGYEYTFYESIKDFFACYVSGKPVPVSAHEALFNMKLERMIAKSSETLSKIIVDDFD